MFIDMTGKRIKGNLLKITISQLEEEQKVDDLLVVFKFDNETALREEIEEFFFHQMSFYPLKWTQKMEEKEV